MKQLLLRFLERFAPKAFWQQARFEFLMFRIRRKKAQYKRAFHKQSELKINFGSGAAGRPGWINVDVVTSPGVSCVVDCRSEQPFADNSARLIFTEHFLEHIEYPLDAQKFLSECRRILKPGGLLRIVVPDAEQYLSAYCTEGWQALENLRLLKSGRRDPYFDMIYETKMELVNMIFRQGNEHKFAYDFETLKHVLEASGFVRVSKMSCGATLGTETPIDLPERAHESLYVECFKSAL